jgi:hypothetical protein
MQHLALLVMAEQVCHQLLLVQMFCTAVAAAEERERVPDLREQQVAVAVLEAGMQKVLPDHKTLAAAVVALEKVLSHLLATSEERVVQVS